MILRRRLEGPLLTRHDVPDIPPILVSATSVFNPGACRLSNGRPMLLLRVQTRGRRTVMMRAFGCGNGGERCQVEPRLVEVAGLEKLGGDVYHVYDPRITRLEDRWYVMCAIDLDRGCRIGIFRTDDFTRLDLVATTGNRDVRNGVLFPEKVGGRYLLLERPNTVRMPGGVSSGEIIEMRSSDDLVHWATEGAVFTGRRHYWDELIGAGPPPVKVAEGWLLIYHGVATHLGGGVYQAGAALLDHADPSKLLGRTRDNLLEPREMYEMVGQVPNVVFPSGLICDPPREDGTLSPDSSVHVVYGAADTCVGLATAKVRELVAACTGSNDAPTRHP
jgi:beta-1,4-mannooligosaccharide/beta-1,4-mannosyl-N-acetylglucosamine phosphorylase